MTRDLRDNVRYPGNGFPERAEGGQLPGSSGNHPWALLARGKTLGKRIVIPWLSPIGIHPPGTAIAVPGPIDLLNINGNDENAQQICLTLSATKLIVGVNSAAPGTTDIQRLTGEVDAIEAAKTAADAGGIVHAGTPDTTWANATAIVKWGIGGVSDRAEVDFHNGMTVNICASWLRVQALIETGDQGTSSVPYVLGAFVGPGFPRPNTAQRTMALGSLTTGGESPVQTVPRFAKAVTLQGGNANNDTYTAAIRFWRSPAGPADFGGVPISAVVITGNDPRPVVVPNGAYYFTVISGISDGGTSNNHLAIFDLAI